MVSIGDFEWANEYEAICLTIVAGADVNTAVRAIAKGAERPVADYDGAVAWISRDSEDLLVFIAAGEVSGTTFVWEDNGFSGSDDEIAKDLSRGGRFVSVYWNVNALSSFVFAVDGEVIVRMDELVFAPEAPEWDLLETAGAHRVSGDDWEEQPRANALLIQAERMGLTTAVDLSLMDAPTTRFWGSNL
jgi:hypothetical protein